MSILLLERFVGSRARKESMLCDECGRLSRENEPTCWRCGKDTLDPISQVGEIYSYTTVHGDDDSFVLALVELPCGKLVTARIIDVHCELRIGMAVEFRPKPPRRTPPGGLYFSPLVTKCVA